MLVESLRSEVYTCRMGEGERQVPEDEDWSEFLKGHGIDASKSKVRPRRPSIPQGTGMPRQRWKAGIVVVCVVVLAAGFWWFVSTPSKLPGSTALEPDPGQSYRESELDPMFHREVGDCFMYDEQVVGTHNRRCSQPHDAEVTSTFQYPANRMPSAGSKYMLKRCSKAAHAYIGPDRADVPPLAISWSIPIIPLWDQGYRDTSCIVTFDSNVEGSVRDAGR